MEVDGDIKPEGTWCHVQRLLNRNGPFAHTEFEPGPEVGRLLLNEEVLQYSYTPCRIFILLTVFELQELRLS